MRYYFHTNKSYTQNMEEINGPSVRCMISSTRNNRNDAKYAIYDVSQNNSLDTRCEVEYTKQKVQFCYQVIIWSFEIQDLRSKIPKQYSNGLTPHSAFQYDLPGMAVLHFSHRYGQSHIIYQVPHHNHSRWATIVNRMTGIDLWCGWRFYFGQSILNALCDVLGVPRRLSI